MHTLIFVDHFVLDGPDITPELRKDITKLNVFMNISMDMADSYAGDLMSLDYTRLNKTQKELYTHVQKMLPKIRAHENLIKYLVHTPSKITKKKTNDNNDNIIKREKVKLENGKEVMMLIEKVTNYKLKAVNGKLQNLKHDSHII